MADGFFSLSRLTDREFSLIAQLVYDTVGIHISAEKRVLVESRLQHLLKQERLATFEDLYHRIVGDTSGEMLSEMINRITTNHTYFLRESAHYDFMTERIFPVWKAERQRDVRIWSAGCSSGEEIYTVALLVREHFVPYFSQEWGLLGTDISLHVLEQAQQGVYASDRLENVPFHLVERYFVPTDESNYQLKEDLRGMVLFKRLNLMSESYPFKGKFDMIWCRNVLIYFDQAHRSQILAKLVGFLRPGGYLFIGHSETLEREAYRLRFIQPAIYQKELA